MKLKNIILLKSLKKNNPYLYNKLKDLNLFEKYTLHMKPSFRYWNKERCIEEIKKYEYLGDLIKASYGCYKHMIVNDLTYLMKDLKRKRKMKTDLY